MHWSRIKSIFIIVFLLLNSFLGYQLWEKKTKKIELAQVYENTVDELLALKNIHLESELSMEQPELAQLHVQLLTYTFRDLAQLAGQNIVIDGHKLVSTLLQAYPLPKPWEEGLVQQEFVELAVMNGAEYRYDSWQGEELLYLQYVEGFPIFRGTLALQLQGEEQIVGYEQIYYHVINRATPQPVISSFTSLRTLLENQAIPSGAVVKQLNLGYFNQIHEGESQVLTPTWRAMIDYEGSRREYYVNAFTGAIVSQLGQE